MNKKLPNSTILLLSLLFIAILVVSVPVLNGSFTGETPGSFEYVRKAEALQEKGKYLDAIKYFEMAYYASPQNEVIRNSLVYAYSRYAQMVAEKEKYDIGIQYLSKALEVVESMYTKQNLAIMYAKRAVVEARASGWIKAQQDLDSARSIVEGSVAGARNLGITLFNDSVEEFKSLREDVAILLLKEAVLIYADSRIFEFLSDIYYKRTDLDQSLFYMDRALQADPENDKLIEKREKIIKEMGLARDETIKALPNFDLKYDKGLPLNAEVVAGILDRAYFDVGKDLSFFPKKKTAVFFYSEKNFRDIFKLGNIVRAFFDGNIRIPLPESMAGESELVSYLYHEYTHAIISAKTNNNCPVWLNEGIAVYEEITRTRPGAVINIQQSSIGPQGISVQSVENVFGDPGVESKRLVSAYILSYTAVEFIVDGWGLGALDRILGKISSGQHAVNAIDDELLLSETEFNRRWSEYVIKKYVKKEEGSS